MPLKVSKRKDRKGYWITGTVNSVRIRESAGTHSRALAEELRSKREAELIRAAIYGAEDATTFAQAVVLYLKGGHSHRFLEPIVREIGDARLSAIKPGEVRDLARKIYPNAAPSTWNRQVIAPFLAVLNFACDRGRARPIRIKRFKETKSKRTAVNRSWIDQFRLGSKTNPYIASMALMMFTTGARLGDILSFRPADIDLQTRVARRQRTKSGEPHEFLLTREMSEELAKLKPRRGRVFGYAQRRHIYAAWKKACNTAGLEYLPPHQAGRHSFATEMIVRQCRDVATTAALGNWKSKKLLLDRYTHAEGLREASDEVFGSDMPQED